LTLQLAPDVPRGRCEIVQLAIPAHKGTGAIAPHAAGTTEYVHLAQGSLEVRVGNRDYELKAGDSIGFQADVRHAYTNAGSSRALLYVVIEHTN
jgi:quercetin dioxygenase-like cupin family protein